MDQLTIRDLYCLIPEFKPMLEDNDITDVHVNDDGVWCARHNDGHYEFYDIELDPKKLLSNVESIASMLGRPLDSVNRRMDGTLWDGTRICIVCPPIVIGNFPSISLRKHSKKLYTLAELVASGTLPQQLADDLVSLAREGSSILASGATGSGKTVLLNALLAELPDEERIISIEDVSEIKLNRPNKVQLITGITTGLVNDKSVDREYTYQTHLISTMRMNPDRVVMGEVRDGEAAAFLESNNTGHSGGLTTMHASSVVDALYRFAGLVLKGSAEGTTQMHVLQEVARNLDVVIQIVNRKVVQVGRVIEYDMQGRDFIIDELYNVLPKKHRSFKRCITMPIASSTLQFGKGFNSCCSTVNTPAA